MIADVPRALYDAQPRGQEPAVRRRAGHAARHRPRHLSVRHLEQLRRRQRRGRRRRRPAPCCTTCSASPRPTPRASAAGRSRPSSIDDVGEHLRAARPRVRRRHRPAAALRLVRRRGAASARSRSTASRACASPSSTCSTASRRCKICVGYKLDGERQRHPAGRRRGARALRAGLRGAAGLEGEHRRRQVLRRAAEGGARLPQAHRGARGVPIDIISTGARPRGDHRDAPPVRHLTNRGQSPNLSSRT